MAERNGRTDNDRRDRREAIRIAVGLLAIAAVVAIVAVLAAPVVQVFFAESLAPGLGVKTAFAWGFALTFVVFVVFAVVAGDGVIGELPIILAGFLAFWAIFSLTIAWIF